MDRLPEFIKKQLCDMGIFEKDAIYKQEYNSLYNLYAMSIEEYGDVIDTALEMEIPRSVLYGMGITSNEINTEMLMYSQSTYPYDYD